MRFSEIISEDANLKRQAAIAIAMKKAGKKPKGVAEAGITGSSRSAEAIAKQKEWNSSSASDSKQDTKTFSYQGYTINFTPDKLNIYLGGDLVFSRKGNFADPTKKQLVAARLSIGKIIDDKRREALIHSVIQKNKGMQGVAEGLDEAVGGNYLYHGRSSYDAKDILSSGMIPKSKTPQKATDAQTQMPNLSVTRDWGYASGANASDQLAGIGRDIVFVLDRNAVESNFKTLGTSQSTQIKGLSFNPYLKKDGEASSQNTDAMARANAKAKAKYAEPTAKSGGEFEEVVVIPKGALPLKGTMVGFWVNPKSELMKDPAIMNDPRRLDMVRPNQFVKAKQEQGVAEGWSQKYKSSINCSHPKGFSQKAHCAGKKKHNESIDNVMEMTCPDCGMCQTHGDNSKDKLDELKCWSGYHRVKGTTAGFPGSCAKNKTNEEQVLENLHKWFKEKWVRFGPDGKIRGDCARGSESEGKPKCLPQSKAHSLGKKGRASAAARKRREDPNANRSGKAINVSTKGKGK